jgi:hypothetical protein
MNDERHNLIAFLAVLGTIGVLFGISAVCLYAGKSVEAIGIGGVMTGLIGVLGTFRPQGRRVTVDNAASDPVPTTPGEAP